MDFGTLQLFLSLVSLLPIVLTTVSNVQFAPSYTNSPYHINAELPSFLLRVESFLPFPKLNVSFWTPSFYSVVLL